MPRRVPSTNAKAMITTADRATMIGTRRSFLSVHSYPSVSQVITGFCHGAAPLRNRNVASDGYERERANQRSHQCRTHGEGHRREQAPLDTFEGEERQISGDENDQREKDGALHFKGGFSNQVDRSPLPDHILPGG